MFRHCPACGAPDLAFDGCNRYDCRTCGFLFYQNTAAACGVILRYEDAVLLLRRGREPALGMLDFPGGFVDPGESAERAVQREIREEIGIDARDLRYFCSGPNRYRFHDVLYHTCDLVFTGTIDEPPRSLQTSEVDAYVLVKRAEIRIEEIAFPSLRSAMDEYISRWSSDDEWPGSNVTVSPLK